MSIVVPLVISSVPALIKTPIPFAMEFLLRAFPFFSTYVPALITTLPALVVLVLDLKSFAAERTQLPAPDLMRSILCPGLWPRVFVISLRPVFVPSRVKATGRVDAAWLVTVPLNASVDPDAVALFRKV